jgi:hypothetical protein
LLTNNEGAPALLPVSRSLKGERFLAIAPSCGPDGGDGAADAKALQEKHATKKYKQNLIKPPIFDIKPR